MRGYEGEMKNGGGGHGEGEGGGVRERGKGGGMRGKRLVMRDEVLGKREEAKSDRKWVRE